MELELSRKKLSIGWCRNSRCFDVVFRSFATTHNVIVCWGFYKEARSNSFFLSSFLSLSLACSVFGDRKIAWARFSAYISTHDFDVCVRWSGFHASPPLWGSWQRVKLCCSWQQSERYGRGCLKLAYGSEGAERYMRWVGQYRHSHTRLYSWATYSKVERCEVISSLARLKLKCGQVMMIMKQMRQKPA